VNSKLILRAVLLFLAWAAANPALMLVAAEPASGDASVKPLFCAYGGVEMIPIPTPPSFEAQFAVVVVEINSPSEISNVAVTGFVLLDKEGKETKLKRVVEIEKFDRPRVATEGEEAYYLNSGGTRPWNGILPAGTIRLRIRIALSKEPIAPVRFKLIIGRHVVEGPVNSAWAT